MNTYSTCMYLTDIEDSSGMVFSYTANAPTFEAGVMEIGQLVGTHHVIPPGTELFNSFGECASECTSRVSSSTDFI